MRCHVFPLLFEVAANGIAKDNVFHGSSLVVPTRHYDRFCCTLPRTIADAGRLATLEGLSSIRHTCGDSLPTLAWLAGLLDHAIDDITDITQRHEGIIARLGIEELDPR